MEEQFNCTYGLLCDVLLCAHIWPYAMILLMLARFMRSCWAICWVMELLLSPWLTYCSIKLCVMGRHCHGAVVMEVNQGGDLFSVRTNAVTSNWWGQEDMTEMSWKTAELTVYALRQKHFCDSACDWHNQRCDTTKDSEMTVYSCCKRKTIWWIKQNFWKCYN